MGYRTYNPDRFTRQSLRLPNRDYASKSAYFVTIRAEGPEPLFEIPELHKILIEIWEALPARFSGVALDEFVIMPDHIHFILWLDRTQENAPKLGDVVGAYKSLTAVAWLRYIKSTGLDMQYPGRIWQRNYYERRVRISELEQTRQYIRNNPIKQKTLAFTKDADISQHSDQRSEM